MSTIFERSKRSTGSRKSGNKYPRDTFKYLSYETDPKPSVLVLGTWANRNTRNILVAGINLNYLSSGQLIRLQKSSDKIFKRDTLRSRYRYLKSILPDIAMYYRTYNTKYIRSIEHGELASYGKANATSRDEKTQTTSDADNIKHADVAAHRDRDPGEIERDAWQLRRRLYEPDKQRRRTTPEKLGGVGSKKAKKAKTTRYVRDRRKLKELERQLELAKELRKIEEPHPADQDELKTSKDLQKELDQDEALDDLEQDDVQDYDDAYHLDDLGYEEKTTAHNIINEESVVGYAHNFIDDVVTLWGWDPEYPEVIDTHVVTSANDTHIRCLDYDRLMYQGRHIASKNVLYGYDTREEEDRPNRDSTYYGDEPELSELHWALKRRFPGHKVIDAFSTWSRTTKKTYKARDLDPVGHWGEDYIKAHHPGKAILSKSRGRNVLAAFDVISKRFIVDSVISHAEMLYDAGWDYDHTVLFEVNNNRLIVKSDCSDTDIRTAIKCFKNNAVKTILCESNG